jgi:hypothetical protein
LRRGKAPTVTETEEQEWRERLRAAVAEVLARRATRAAIRRQLDERRQAGLAVRHREKLKRATEKEP